MIEIRGATKFQEAHKAGFVIRLDFINGRKAGRITTCVIALLKTRLFVMPELPKLKRLYVASSPHGKTKPYTVIIRQPKLRWQFTN
ncbi:MAG: hypothetical protein H0A75_04080 [Candidatus Methanofishera endochildressiae]|uniref:Uncharacterized protein n=1 Tax=Candidatus Methanofishera endochildressiae TaxID=2738884 RepID=A0A7Z0MNI8_9GAMM|nr:hypothetical protein [Candidatus Methanofishera endochildressiae]